MARKPKPDGDLGVDPRRVDVLAGVLPGDIREVTPIDLRWRSGLPDLGRSVFAAWRTLSSRHANPLSLGGDGVLEFGVRDIEAVLCGQLDAHSLEPLVSPNGERAPLLGAQLEGGENAFPSVAVVDVDLLTPVREGRRASLANATIVDMPTLDEGGECPDVLGRRALEGRPFYGGRPSFSMSPPLREILISLMQPFPVAREPSPIPVQLGTLQLLAIALLRLLLRLTRGQHAPGRIEELSPSLPRSAKDVGPFSPMPGEHALPLLLPFLRPLFPSGCTLQVVAASRFD